MIIGYTSGVFDLFHVGHVRVLKNAKSMCDRLIVGVSTDELVSSYKNKTPVISFDERLEIVSAMQYVDVAVAQNSLDKFDAWEHYKFQYMFVGDDWYKSESWEKVEEQFKEVGVKIVYFPYTKSTSSTLINNTLEKLRSERES